MLVVDQTEAVIAGHGTGVIELVLDTDIGGSLQRSLEVIASVENIRVTGHEVLITCNEPQSDLLHVLAECARHNRAVSAINIVPASLESAFINLTGDTSGTER